MKASFSFLLEKVISKSRDFNQSCRIRNYLIYLNVELLILSNIEASQSFLLFFLDFIQKKLSKNGSFNESHEPNTKAILFSSYKQMIIAQGICKKERLFSFLDSLRFCTFYQEHDA